MSCTPCNFDPTTAHHFAAGLYAKESRVPAGYVVGKHIHAYSHLSVLAQGVAKVTAGDVVIEYTAPACIEIKAGIQHKVEAVTDVIWYCIHATDETDKDRVDEVLIHKEE